MEQENMSIQDLPIILHVRDVARLLEISEDYARELMRARDFPLAVLGHQFVVSRSDFISWIESKEIHRADGN